MPGCGVALTWFLIALLPADAAAGDVRRMRDAFADRAIDAGTPDEAALFGGAREDGGKDLYFTPLAGQIARSLLVANGAVACLAPVDDGTMKIIIGEGKRSASAEFVSGTAAPVTTEAELWCRFSSP
jgi:hypothetical protein